MKKRICTGLLLFAATLFACKKDNTPAPKTTQEKIQGKWQYVSTVINSYYNGAPHITTLTGNAGDYADFRSDNKVYTLTMGSYDTSAYAIINDSKLWIDAPSDEFEIKSLTDSEFKLYSKEVISPTEYLETNIILSK